MLPRDQLNRLLSNPALLKEKIALALHRQAFGNSDYLRQAIDPVESSAVLFLLTPGCDVDPDSPGPCLVLNKRSDRVRQPGDLCCPGGSISIKKDGWLARMLCLPFTPLTRWRFWHNWMQTRNQEASNLSFLLATGIRESYEEMRLNPFRLRFLGPLPSQQLVMFERTIFPMVCWIPQRNKYTLNWEVERVVNVPLRHLFDSAQYARFRLTIETSANGNTTEEKIFPCLLLEDGSESEMLWGATFRITMAFLQTVFDFKTPELDDLPEIAGQLERNYLTGNNQPLNRFNT